MTSPRFDVVAIGNAIVDVLTQASDQFLIEQGLKKGTMALLDQAEAEELYKAMGSGIESSGGSAANTIAAVAQLGGKAGFIGRVRNDQLGEIFAHDLRATGASFDTPAAEVGAATARCMILGGEVALSLSDPFCVDRHRTSFQELVEGHVDILFANEDEIKSLYLTDSFEQATDLVRGHCKLACLTRSSQGSLVLAGDATHVIPAYQLGDLLDTTGAGDCYAAGFLYGYSQGWDPNRCGHAGSICAAQIVTQMGPRSQVDLKDLIEHHLASFK